MSRCPGIPESLKPSENQLPKRRPVYNKSLKHFEPEFFGHWKRPIPDSRKVWYLENGYRANRHVHMNSDFVFAGEVVLLSPQADFLKNYFVDRSNNSHSSIHKRFNISKRYVLTGHSVNDLCDRMYSVAQTHIELNYSFEEPFSNFSNDFFVEKPNEEWFGATWFERMYAFGERVRFDIVPNSRCFHCLKPVNQLIDECVIDTEITKNFRERETIICKNCHDEIHNPKPVIQISEAVKMRREAYRKGDKSIHWTVIGPQEDWKCHICGEEVEQNSKPDNPRGATVEHLTPTSIGGEHEYENVRLAHKGCNSSKGNRRDDRKVNS